MQYLKNIKIPTILTISPTFKSLHVILCSILSFTTLNNELLT